MKRQRYSFSNKVTVRQTKKKGRGMVATAPIAKGEVIEVAPAILLPRREVDDLLTGILGHYIFSTDRGGRFVVGLGYTSVFNHSRRPNAEFFVTTETVTIKARHAIHKGDEVTVAYGWTASEWVEVGGRVD